MADTWSLVQGHQPGTDALHPAQPRDIEGMLGLGSTPAPSPGSSCGSAPGTSHPCQQHPHAPRTPSLAGPAPAGTHIVQALGDVGLVRVPTGGHQLHAQAAQRVQLTLQRVDLLPQRLRDRRGLGAAHAVGLPTKPPPQPIPAWCGAVCGWPQARRRYPPAPAPAAGCRSASGPARRGRARSGQPAPAAPAASAPAPGSGPAGSPTGIAAAPSAPGSLQGTRGMGLSLRPLGALQGTRHPDKAPNRDMVPPRQPVCRHMLPCVHTRYRACAPARRAMPAPLCRYLWQQHRSLLPACWPAARCPVPGRSPGPPPASPARPGPGCSHGSAPEGGPRHHGRRAGSAGGSAAAPGTPAAGPCARSAGEGAGGPAWSLEGKPWGTPAPRCRPCTWL